MARKKKKTASFKVDYITAKYIYHSKFNVIATTEDGTEVTLALDINNCYGLIGGMRIAIKHSKKWLNDVETRLSTPINHQAPGDVTT